MGSFGNIEGLIEDLGEIPIYLFGKPKEPVLLKDLEDGPEFDVCLILRHKDYPLGIQSKTRLYHTFIDWRIINKEILKYSWVYAEKVEEGGLVNLEENSHKENETYRVAYNEAWNNLGGISGKTAREHLANGFEILSRTNKILEEQR